MENQTRKPAAAKSGPKQQYLLFYNLVCVVLWGTVLLRATLLIPTLFTHGKLYGLLDALFPLLKWTQTLALLEVVHSVVGLVRASPVTTAMQVASRILVVWGVLDRYPEIVTTTNVFGRHEAGTTGGPVGLAGILIAWGVTEVIRYGFFVYKEGISERIPAWLTWLRYNTFFVLYPIGITSECLLIYLAINPAQKEGKSIDWLFKAVLGIYVPGSYILYTHMMSQRRKVMRGKGKTN